MVSHFYIVLGRLCFGTVAFNDIFNILHKKVGSVLVSGEFPLKVLKVSIEQYVDYQFMSLLLADRCVFYSKNQTRDENSRFWKQLKS